MLMLQMKEGEPAAAAQMIEDVGQGRIPDTSVLLLLSFTLTISGESLFFSPRSRMGSPPVILVVTHFPMTEYDFE